MQILELEINASMGICGCLGERACPYLLYDQAGAETRQSEYHHHCLIFGSLATTKVGSPFQHPDCIKGMNG